MATGVVSQPWTRLLGKTEGHFLGLFFFLMETEIQRCLICCLPFRTVGFSLEGTGTAGGREAVPLPSKQVSLLRPLCSACAPTRHSHSQGESINPDSLLPNFFIF